MAVHLLNMAAPVYQDFQEPVLVNRLPRTDLTVNTWKLKIVDIDISSLFECFIIIRNPNENQNSGISSID